MAGASHTHMQHRPVDDNGSTLRSCFRTQRFDDEEEASNVLQVGCQRPLRRPDRCSLSQAVLLMPTC